MGTDQSVPRANWAGNVIFRAREFHAPSTIAGLQRLVARSGRLRTLGSGHSFNGLADTTGDLVSVAGLPELIEIDTARAQVSVSAGVRYGELAPRLHHAGFALRNLGSLPHISIAGACATGTHGSGTANGNLATHVAALDLVTASGDSVTVTRDHDPDRFPGMVVALGCLGVVTRMTLDLVAAYDLAQYVYDDLPDEALDLDLLPILAGGYSVSVFTDLRTQRVWRKCRADEPVPGELWFGARPAPGPAHPVHGVAPAHCTQQGGVRGPWHLRLPHFRLEFTPSVGEELQSEYLLPRRHAAEALRTLRGLSERIAPVLQVVEIRSVAADDLWLSPSNGRDTVAFHFTWTADEAAVLRVLPAIEERLVAFAPRPHWAKLFTLSPATVQAQYPKLSDFARLVDEYDPTGKFGNELTHRYLG